jgi:hypothetical protein
MMMMRISACLALAVAATGLAAAPPPRVVAAAGRWAALGGGGQCDAATLSLLPASKTRAQGRASLTFDGARRRGQFVAALSKPVAGASVMLTIDDQPFLLVARGGNAWSRGPRQEAAIIASLRSATRMRIEGRSARGLRFIDRFDPAGAPTAIDAAAACAARR